MAVRLGGLHGMADTQAQFEDRFVPRLLASIGKARQRGLSWLIERARRELRVPTSAPGRLLRNILASIEHGARRSMSALASKLPNRRPASPGTLYFFIDLEISPITFDVVTGLAAAELHRRRLGLERIHIVVVPGTVDGLKEEAADYAAIVSPEARRWRIYHLLIPLFRLLPSCAGYTLCGSRREASVNWFAGADHVFPSGYSVAFPLFWDKRDVALAAQAGEPIFPMFRAPPQALDYMRRFLEPRAAGRRVVVINLRRYAYMPGRNSNDANWVAFAHELDQSRWLPVFVLDTDVALDPKPPELEGFVVCEAVPFNIELRMALYELADITMAVTQGPMELCWLNERCCYASFVKPGSSIHTTDDHYRSERAYETRQGPPFVTPKQRWVWEYDELPIIRKVFVEMTGG
jgi:hypothetical protein